MRRIASALVRSLSLPSALVFPLSLASAVAHSLASALVLSLSLASALVFSLSLPVTAHAQGSSEQQEVQRVVEQGYVQGMHALQDPELAREGFHPDFVMKVRQDDGIVSVTRDEWIARLGPRQEPGARDVRSEYDMVDVTGNTAVVKLRLFIDGTHRFTDYMSLYRTAEGWKIVAKVFEAHR